MKKLYSLLLSFAAVGAFAQDGAPAVPYYNGFDFSQTGMTLKSALATKITTTHTHTLTYQQAEFAIKVTDVDYEESGSVNLMLLYGFSSSTCPDSQSDDKDHRKRHTTFEDDGTAASCMWNREHTYPKALGTPDLGTTGPGADAHHLRACDKKRNADRDNDKFFDSEGDSHEVGLQWYPGDEWKGDVARMVMYMYLRYGTRCLPKNVGVGVTNTVDANMIDLFLEWNAEDPVSPLEDNRNTYLGNLSNDWAQGNRNPFIDNPYLATIIWGGTPAQNRWPDLLATDHFNALATVAIYPNPSVDHRINIQSADTIDSIDLITVNGQLLQQVKNPVSQDGVYTLENLPGGFYFLKLVSGSDSIVKKISVN